MTTNKKHFDKVHKTLFDKVRSSIRRLKIKKSDKKILIADVSNANGDLMHLLATPNSYADVSDYFDTINAYLKSEYTCYDSYQKKPLYKIGQMSNLMEYVRRVHVRIDRIEELKAKVGLE
tara:strand:+ start:684 stop:1043 length:360 start_codon:yes stop_codon:yes gene_type:complete